MNIPATDPLALAALELARETLDSKDPKTAFMFKKAADQYEFKLHAPGAVSIHSTQNGPGRINFSMSGYFNVNPVVNVQAKRGKITVGPKGYPMSERVKKSDAAQVVANAAPKTYSV